MIETNTNINESVETNYLKYLFKFMTLCITIVVIVFIVQAIKLGIFEDKMLLVNYIKGVGIWAPILFILLQIFQVIVPIIPGGISCLAGVLAFGPILGFVYNYIGLVIGSCIVYYLSKKYGIKLIKKIFNKETVNKYINYIDSNRFEKIFFLMILLPGLPDDLLCYIAGINSISFKKFISIILVGKPIALLMYSLFMNFL